MWQPIETVPKDGTIVDLCLYCEDTDSFYRNINSFYENDTWYYKDDNSNSVFTVWCYDKKIVAWMYPIAPPDIKLINMPIDTPVIATDIDGTSFNAHFAGTDGLGNPLVWVSGKTSFTGTVKYECESVKKFTDTSQENK